MSILSDRGNKKANFKHPDERERKDESPLSFIIHCK